MSTLVSLLTTSTACALSLSHPTLARVFPPPNARSRAPPSLFLRSYIILYPLLPAYFHGLKKIRNQWTSQTAAVPSFRS